MLHTAAFGCMEEERGMGGLGIREREGEQWEPIGDTTRNVSLLRPSLCGGRKRGGGRDGFRGRREREPWEPINNTTRNASLLRCVEEEREVREDMVLGVGEK